MGKGIFKTDFGGTSRPNDPEALFRDLRGRSSEIKHLWAHQADSLRNYHQNYLDSKDVAIELPTGAGKTLVGLLIAEFRRRVFDERIAYLCPTRQLAHQVGSQAMKYGIKAHVFVGKQRDYSPAQFSDFQSGKALAVTTYSSVFNSNPRISDAQALVLDDAHAGENYIASMWTVEIDRRSLPDAFVDVIKLLKDGLPSGFYADILDDNPGKRGTDLVELVPGEFVRKHDSGLKDVLDACLIRETPPWYAWGLIKNHLTACVLFVSNDTISFRPFIPPALTHTPFMQAKQRIYMSATLGAGGELERVTGVKNIERVPIPAGWDKRGSGKRLFLVPHVAMSDKDAMATIVAAADSAPRSLVLTPTQRAASEFQEEFNKAGIDVIGASDIEDSIKPFSEKERVALMLSRYDGLDLPDETCRLLIMGGLPSGTSLQERFLWSRLAASSLLRDRVLTRFTQGVGRCTRSDNDFAVVFVWGTELMEFILKQENRAILNPGLQAELKFGIENSQNKKTTQDFKNLWDEFNAQSDVWKDAEDAIARIRESSIRLPDPISEKLRSSVTSEVDYVYANWRGDFESSLKHARAAADILEGDNIKGYRGWWYYLGSDAAAMLHEVDHKPQSLAISKDFLRRAADCCTAISWFARLGRTLYSSAVNQTAKPEEITAMAAENIRGLLTKWGSYGSRFETQIKAARENLRATGHKTFHQGLMTLGSMLGFKSVVLDGTGDPDCLWSIGEDIYIVHEAKSDETPNDPIGVNDIRQAQSHETWTRTKRPAGKSTVVVPVIVTPRTKVHEEAALHAKTLCHFTPSQMIGLFGRSAEVLRRIRASLNATSDEGVLELLNRELVEAKLTPEWIIKEISTTKVSALPKSR